MHSSNSERGKVGSGGVLTHQGAAAFPTTSPQSPCVRITPGRFWNRDFYRFPHLCDSDSVGLGWATLNAQDKITQQWMAELGPTHRLSEPGCWTGPERVVLDFFRVTKSVLLSPVFEELFYIGRCVYGFIEPYLAPFLYVFGGKKLITCRIVALQWRWEQTSPKPCLTALPSAPAQSRLAL